MQVYKILLPLNFDEPFDYASDVELQPGDIVKIPFRSSIKIGVVWGVGESEIANSKIKKVSEKLPLPPFPHKLRKFIDWTAEYNMSPRGNILKMALSVKFTKKTFNSPPAGESKAAPPQGWSYTEVPLSEMQSNAVAVISSKLKRKYSTTVIDGVTGSGKTEVYFEAINKSLENGKQVLVLLPEIGLSVQWLQRFQKRFGIEPGIWHSDRSEKQRRETWLDVISGNCKVVVGARSALYLPFNDLGLIIVDEEHDQSYKQEEGVIYHGRDMAVSRASIENIPLLLVSATPSVETVNNINEGKYQVLHLPERFGGAEMPEIKLIDMRQQRLKGDKFISPELKDELQKAISHKQQAILFLNRRGYAPLTLCRACGHRIQCPNCSAWMVQHRTAHGSQVTLVCHHCNHSLKMPEACPACHEKDKLHACGPGVERLKEEVTAYFPDARVEVMASDSPKTADHIVNRMLNHEIDILIGTQMIAKGHHFAKLSLVGIVDADLGLEGGDLRAMERTYQVLHQVSGRAGREEELGKVILQTYNPDSIVMQALGSGGRDEFVEHELMARRRFEMPPFGRLATITVSGKNEGEVRKFITSLSLNAPRLPEVDLLGPAPSPMSFLRGQHRYRLLLKSGKKFNMQKYIRAVLDTRPAPSSLKIKIDVDPFSFI